VALPAAWVRATLVKYWLVGGGICFSGSIAATLGLGSAAGEYWIGVRRGGQAEANTNRFADVRLGGKRYPDSGEAGRIPIE